MRPSPHPQPPPPKHRGFGNLGKSLFVFQGAGRNSNYFKGDSVLSKLLILGSWGALSKMHNDLASGGALHARPPIKIIFSSFVQREIEKCYIAKKQSEVAGVGWGKAGGGGGGLEENIIDLLGSSKGGSPQRSSTFIPSAWMVYNTN